MPREAADSPSLEVFHQVGWDSEQPSLVEVPGRCRGVRTRWSIRSFPNQTKPFYDSMNLLIWMKSQITQRGNLYQICVTFVLHVMRRFLNKQSESYCLKIFPSSVRTNPHSQHHTQKKMGYSVWICKKSNCFQSSYCSVRSMLRNLVLIYTVLVFLES